MCNGSGCCPSCIATILILKREIELLQQLNEIEQATANNNKAVALQLAALLKDVRDQLAASTPPLKPGA